MSGDAVTQAREAVLQGVVDQMNAALRAVGSDAKAVLETNRSTALDAYAAALLAAERQRVVGMVEELKREHDPNDEDLMKFYDTKAHNAALSQLAARLTGGE